MALALIALVAVLIAVAFFAYAFFLWLAGMLTPPLAAAACGLILVIIAIILALVSRGTIRRRGRNFRSDVAGEAAENAALLGSLLGRKAHSFAKSNSTYSLLAMLIAGFAVGLSPKLRALLLSLLKI